MLLPGPGIVEQAQAAEANGYSRVWLSDSPAFYRDVWMTLAEVAEHTNTIGLGPAVLVPSLRHVVTQAAAVATLESLAPGRAVVAVGTGFTGRMALGQQPMPWAEVAEYVAAVRTLLAGGDAEVEGRRVRLMQPGGYVVERPTGVPVLVAANGPKGLAVARELGDGVMTIGGGQPEFDWCAALTLGTVLRDGESADSPRVAGAVGPGLVALYHGAYEAGSAEFFPGGEEWAATVDQIPEATRHLELHADHLVTVTERDATLVDAAVITDFTWTGTPDEVAARAVAAGGEGVTEVLYAPGGPDPLGEIERFAGALSDVVGS